MKKILNKQIFYSFKFHLILTVSFIIFSIFGLFYYDFYQVAQSESGLFFYPSHTFENNFSSWGSYYFGSRTSSFLNYLTFPFVYFTFSDFKFPFLIQFLYYISLALLGFCGFYLLLDYYNKDYDNKIEKLYLSLIVIYNPAALSVIARFQYPYIALYFLLPIILFLTLKTFDSLNLKDFFKNLLLLNLIVSIFSILYAAMTSLIIIFLLWIVVGVIYLVKNCNFSFFKKLVLFFIFWFLINSFWLAPFFIENIKSNTLANSNIVLNDNDNISTLLFFSKRDSTFTNIFTLISDEYLNLFFGDSDLSKSLYRLISFIPLIFLLIVFRKFLKKYNFKKLNLKKFDILILLFIVFFLITRGTNFPFKEVYLFVFTKISFLQVFRNSFEKGILIFYLPYLLFFTLSSLYLFKLKMYKKIFILFVAVYITTNCYMYLTSRPFLGGTPPYDDPRVGYKVKVPEYYLNASKIINSTPSNLELNTLVLPLVSEGITYDWNYGYVGADILHQILSKNTYSFLAPDRYSDRSKVLENLVYSKNKQAVLNMYNFKYLALRNDYKFLDRSQINPDSLIEMVLNNHVPDFKDLHNTLNYNLVVNYTKNSNIFEGINYQTSNGSLSFAYDNEDSLYLSFLSNEIPTFPMNKPYFIVLQSSDIRKIADFEKVNLRKEVKENAMFSNNSLCKGCFVSDVIYQNSSRPVTSLRFKIFPKKSGNSLKIDRIGIGYFEKDPSDYSTLTKVYDNKVQLFENKSELSLLKCYDKYEKYENISKFIYEDFDPLKYLYIKESQFPEILNEKKLYDCKLNYKKISNGEYLIEIKNSNLNGKFNTILNFNQSADSLWKLVGEDDTIFGKLSFDSDKSHFVSNTFSNSFYLENIPAEGKKYRLIYLPEFYFKVFVYVSILTLIGILSFIFWPGCNKNRNN